MNKFTATVNTTAPIALTYTQGGVAIAKTGVAMNTYYTDSEGAKKSRVCFIDVVAYGKRAETMNQYVKKGDKLLIEAELTLEQWQAPEGGNRQRHVLTLESVEFLTPRPAQQN